MANGINKVILIGNLGGDPEVRYFPSGDAVANLRIATSETWKDSKTGEPREQTEWHRVVVRGKLAEVAKNYLHKGSKVYLEGKLHTRKYQDQGGQERYVTEILVGGVGSTFQMLDGRPTGEGSGGGRGSPAPAAGPGVRMAAEEPDFDSDGIPF